MEPARFRLRLNRKPRALACVLLLAILDHVAPRYYQLSPTRDGIASGKITMRRAIVGFHTDEEGHWVANLECGHTQHVRHRPPWINRPWVTTERGRCSMLGYRLWCKRCEESEPASA